MAEHWQARDGMPGYHPPAPTPDALTAETSGGLEEVLRATHRDSYPMGNIHHGTPERPDWGTFCVGCKESWPCEVTQLLDVVAAREAAAANRGRAEGLREAGGRADTAFLVGARFGRESERERIARAIESDESREGWGGSGLRALNSAAAIARADSPAGGGR